MSRSFRKTPKFGITTAKSEKKDKRIANRACRRVVRAIEFEDDLEIPLRRELANVWLFGKDGKKYWRSPDVADMRK